MKELSRKTNGPALLFVTKQKVRLSRTELSYLTKTLTYECPELCPGHNSAKIKEFF